MEAYEFWALDYVNCITDLRCFARILQQPKDKQNALPRKYILCASILPYFTVTDEENSFSLRNDSQSKQFI